MTTSANGGRGTAVVTGATRGIGLAVASTLAERGHPVFICARDETAVAETVKDLRGRGHTVDGAACDVTSAESVGAWVSAAVERFGPVEVLVNNAAAAAASPPRSPTSCGSTSSTPTSTASSW